MADGDSEEAALARLRMFLAPHAPTRASDHPPEEHSTKSPDHPQTSEGANEAAHHSSGAANESEELSADLSTLADQLGGAVSDMDSHAQPTNQSPESADIKPPEAEYPTAPPVEAVSTVSPLLASSKEFNRVRYLLQYSMPGFRLHDDLLMWDMKSPALIAQYEERACGLLELDSWVDVDELSAAMSDVHAFGFPQVSTAHHAKKLSTGIIHLDPNLHKKGRKQLVLCKIAVGKALPVFNVHEAEQPPLPPGYHSYRIATADQTEQTHDQRYSHEYILHDALQILPQYLVRFSFSAVEVKKSQACALCETSPATLVCKSCDAELCAKCDTEVHSANKLVGRHKRTAKRDIAGRRTAADTPRRRSSAPQAEGDADDPSHLSTVADAATNDELNTIISKHLEDSMGDFQATCSVHGDKKIEFFCPVCSIPVCINCKMVGDHSIGDKGSHRLLSISDAYERSLRESFKCDPLVESRKTVIENKLAQIAGLKRDVQANRDQVEASIKMQYEQTRKQLEEEAQKKMQVLNGEAMELERQVHHIDWLEDCLDEQRSTCSVIDFLSSWIHHKVLRAEQRDFPAAYHSSSRSGELVKADLQVVGQLHVVAGDDFERSRSFTVAETTESRRQSLQSGPTSPRGSLGTLSPSMQSIRRASDNEIRRKLLSVRPVNPAHREGTPREGNTCSSSARSTLSPEGLKMMEELRRDVLTRAASQWSPGHQSTGFLLPRRTFCINPTRSSILQKLADDCSSDDAWTALLRHELAVVKSTGSG